MKPTLKQYVVLFVICVSLAGPIYSAEGKPEAEQVDLTVIFDGCSKGEYPAQNKCNQIAKKIQEVGDGKISTENMIYASYICYVAHDMDRSKEYAIKATVGKGNHASFAIMACIAYRQWGQDSALTLIKNAIRGLVDDDSKADIWLEDSLEKLVGYLSEVATNKQVDSKKLDTLNVYYAIKVAFERKMRLDIAEYTDLQNKVKNQFEIIATKKCSKKEKSEYSESMHNLYLYTWIVGGEADFNNFLQLDKSEPITQSSLDIFTLDRILNTDEATYKYLLYGIIGMLERSKDHTKLYEFSRESLKKPTSFALCALAKCYSEGWGVDKSNVKRETFERLADLSLVSLEAEQSIVRIKQIIIPKGKNTNGDLWGNEDPDIMIQMFSSGVAIKNRANEDDSDTIDDSYNAIFPYSKRNQWILTKSVTYNIRLFDKDGFYDFDDLIDDSAGGTVEDLLNGNVYNNDKKTNPNTDKIVYIFVKIYPVDFNAIFKEGNQ